MAQLSFDRFEPGLDQPGDANAPARWFAFRGGDLLVADIGDAISIPVAAGLGSLGLPAASSHYLGLADGTPCRAAEIPAGTEAPAGWSFEGIRSLFGRLSDSFFSVAARALEVLDWDRSHRFCGACGTATVLKQGERARECPACRSLSYPRISPAVIVAVSRGDRLLLARARRFPPGFYSVLAGFVEPGETLEECVRREVQEETGIEVANIRYFGSQPWPFPHSLMIAFTAEHRAGEIAVDRSELVDAGWYAVDALPKVPDPITVARRLIDGWIATQRRNP